MKSLFRSIRRSGRLISALALILLSLIPGQGAFVAAQGKSENAHAIRKVSPHVFRGDVRNLPQTPARPKIELELHEPPNRKQAVSGEAAPAPSLATAAMPAPLKNFAGMNRTDSCTGGQCGAGIPPDTNGDVGLSYYIQAVNSAFAIYNKSGTRLAAFTEDSLWLGSGQGACDGNSEGDPVVVYDALADRWILTDFAFAFSGGNPVSPYYECIAVSQTNNPVSGGWILYAIRIDTNAAGQPPLGTLGDYPKFGIWTDCLYLAANGFNSAGDFVGGVFGAFSRSDMYAGLSLTGSLGFLPSNPIDTDYPNYFTMIPSNLSAPGVSGVPTAGTPNYYVQESFTAYKFLVRKFTTTSNCGSGTLGAATSVSQTSYSVPNGAIIPQPATARKLDSLGDRLMQKVQYRKVGSAESLWVTHTFRSPSSGPTGQQWAQLNVTGGTVATTPVQQQLYNPAGGLYRWMGSLAVDKSGNMALGYSSSGASSPHYPSLAYAGRLATDPVNTLPQTEVILKAGAGSQVNNCGGAPCDRWGDYSSMSVDPSDGCTFWYTNEYYTSQTNGNTGSWNTRIGSFKFPTCGVGSKTFYSTGTQDGLVLESGENTSLGGTLNATATTFNLGDDVGNKQDRAILSFSTGSLPDNAIITSVTLKIKQAGQGGSNPFSTLGNILADIRKGPFNANSALELVDFQAVSSKDAVLSFTNTPSSGWYSKALGSGNFSFINLTGTTQFRLRFAIDDNNNHVADYLQFYSGNFTTTTSRPTLIVKYKLP